MKLRRPMPAHVRRRQNNKRYRIFQFIEAAQKLLRLPKKESAMFFAGEACSQHDYSTAHGAYLTGVAAAEQVIAARRGQRSRTQGRVWAISKAVFFRPPRCGESENGAYLNRRPCTTPSCGNSTRGNALARAPRAPVRIKQSRGGEPGAYLGLADAQAHPSAASCSRRGARSAFTRDRAARPSATRVPPPAVAGRSPAPESLNSRLCVEFLSSC